MQVQNAKLLSLSGSYQVNVFKNICSTCNYESKYDGLKDDIFWKNSKMLWTHALQLQDINHLQH